MKRDNSKYSNNFINLEDLVYTPLHAISQSNINLSGSVIDLIASTGSINPTDENNTIHLKTVNLAYEQINNDSMNGKIIEEIGLKIPLVSVLPITNLQVKKTKLSFDAEIKKIHKDNKNNKYIMESRVCSRAKQRRKDDGLPKLSFEIELESVPVSEGMARIIDVLNANPIPEILSSKQIDDRGEVVVGEEAAYYQKMKMLKLKEGRINRTADKLTALIAKKKLMFDNLINISEKQGKFDTLFTENESDNQIILEKVANNCNNHDEAIKIYENIKEIQDLYNDLMKKSLQLSEVKLRNELEHIKKEIENEE